MLADLTDTIGQLNANRAPKVEIRVDDPGTVIAAIERAGVPLINYKPSEPVTGGTFMGVPIVIDNSIPPGFAAVIKDGEVVSILDLRDKGIR